MYSIQRQIETLVQANRILDRMARQPQNHFETFMTNVADDSISMAVDGSVTPVVFRYVAPEKLYLQSIKFTFVDTTITFGGFMALSELTNGFDVKVYNSKDELQLDFYNGETITTTYDLFTIGDASVFEISGGGGEDLVTSEISLNGRNNTFMILNEGDYLETIISDNLTGLIDMTAFIRGFKKFFDIEEPILPRK